MSRIYAILLLTLACLSIHGADAKKNPVVIVETTLGSFEVELYPDKAPETVKNFLGYVKDKFYDGTIIHRVSPNPKVFQGGGFTEEMKEKKTKAAIKNEANNGLKNDKGTIAMARMADPDTANSQFYINTEANDFLNHTAKTPQGWGYCVFGKVIAGDDVVEKIKNAKVGTAKAQTSFGPADLTDVPVETIVIKSMKVKE